MTSKPEYVAVLVPPVVSIIGKPDCGKTTLLEKLIPELTNQGYRVGTIKHHVHEFEMDKPGKDTWKHKQAGRPTCCSSHDFSEGTASNCWSNSR